MMKSIWRHVRLKKGFVNLEAAQYGGMKLRIPQLLFSEKMRTQSRFNVRMTYRRICIVLLKHTRAQVMRMMEQTAASVEPQAESRGSNAKHAQNASNKIHLVVQKVLLPLLHTPLPGAVSFRQVRD